MKYYYLRPRQDFTLARFAKVIEILNNEDYTFTIYVKNEPQKNAEIKPVIFIMLQSHRNSRISQWGADHAVKRICELSDCTDRDFRVCEFEIPFNIAIVDREEEE